MKIRKALLSCFFVLMILGCAGCKKQNDSDSENVGSVSGTAVVQQSEALQTNTSEDAETPKEEYSASSDQFELEIVGEIESEESEEKSAEVSVDQEESSSVSAEASKESGSQNNDGQVLSEGGKLDEKPSGETGVTQDPTESSATTVIELPIIPITR